MDIYQPQLQNPFGYDNLNDRAKYLHSALYRLMHQRGANYCARVDPEPDPEFQTITFNVVSSKDGQSVDPDGVLVDGEVVSFMSESGFVTVNVPAKRVFELTISKGSYVLFKDSFTADQLSGSSQEMDPMQVAAVTFKVVDSKNSSPVNPDAVLIDGESAVFVSVGGFVTVDVPSDRVFRFTLNKDGYVLFDDDFTRNQLIGVSLSITPVQTVVDEIESKVRWMHSVVKDLDMHLLVHSRSGKKLAEVYYSNKTWHDSNVSVRLDRDDTGNFDGETLTITPLYDGYDYTLVLYDYSNGTNTSSMKMSQSDTAVTVTYNNQSQTINIPPDTPGVFWNVYQIINGEMNVVNTVTQTNDYGITQRNRGGK